MVITGTLRSVAADDKRKRNPRPPQKLFDVDAVRAIGGEVTPDGDFMLFESNRSLFIILCLGRTTAIMGYCSIKLI